MSAPQTPSPVAALLDGLAGRWPTAARGGDARPPQSDPLGAVAAAIDSPATASGPLDGSTVAVKDNVAVAGAPMALGSGLPGFVPPRDAEIVARIRAQGGHIVAKAQCEAFLLGSNSFTSRPNPVRNPHDPSRSAGGSSGGSAAMVAAGLADLAVGTDSGGSIRVPAAFCGVVGFKPTRGRVPYTGIAPLEPFLEHAGPIARDVRGAARLFRALDGGDGVDPRTVWARRSDRSPGEPIRLGVPEALLALAEPAVATALRSALDDLSDAGLELVTLEWSEHEETVDLSTALYLTGQSLAAAARFVPPGFAATVPGGWPDWRNGLSEVELPAPLLAVLAAGDALIARDPGLYGRAAARAIDIADGFDALLESVDALVMPTSPGVAPPIPDGEPTEDEVFGDTRLTAPFNVTGNPAISLPAGLAKGLPVALQIVAPRGADEALLILAERIEPLLPITPKPVGDFGSMR